MNAKTSTGAAEPARWPLAGSTWISEWNPEDEKFWESKGKFIARRNLIWSILAEHLGFSIWMVWSIVATKLPQAGFNYTTDQLFQLVALPGLVGSLMRFPYTFAVPRFGGRNWTIVSAALLFIPAIALAYFVTRPDTPFSLMLIVTATAGLGGGNFASSMANISFFYPNRMKGWALGLNAAGGNIGVSSVQLLIPIVIGFGWVSLYMASPQGSAGLYLQNAGLMWLPLIALAVFGAYRHMNNLTSARSTLKDQLIIVKRKHTWVMAWLYIGTFGSFIGYSAAFPLLLKTQFPAITVGIAFLGPLVGSVARPLGGLLADKLGGARVTFWNFVVMGAATLGVMHFVEIKSFTGFLVMFTLRHDRHRQWLDFPDDPLNLPRGEAQGGKGLGRRGAGAGPQGGRNRECRRARLHIGDRRLRRIPHPARLRRLDCRHRRTQPGIGSLPDVLRHLRGAYLAVRPAGQAARRPEPRRSTRVRRG
jgi:NNP family nitrate/nitrite transporter-like MFS transporter